MKRMVTRDRKIHLVSGHMGSGKSYYFKFLSDLPEYQGPRVFKTSKDTTYLRHYGWRIPGPVEDNQNGYHALYDVMTPKDRFYANELLRVDTERAILVNDATTALLDAGMASRKFHQRPFIAMVRKTEELLGSIDSQRAEKMGMLPPNPAPRVNLRVVFLFCDFETIRRRMETRWESSTSGGKLPVPLIESMRGYEVSMAYTFLGIDTSDESPGVEKKRKSEIKSFFAGKTLDPDLITARTREAKRCILATKRAMRKLL